MLDFYDVFYESSSQKVVGQAWVLCWLHDSHTLLKSASEFLLVLFVFLDGFKMSMYCHSAANGVLWRMIPGSRMSVFWLKHGLSNRPVNFLNRLLGSYPMVVKKHPTCQLNQGPFLRLLCLGNPGLSCRSVYH